MIDREPPDPEKLVVRATYFVPLEIEEQNLIKIKNILTNRLQQEGYQKTEMDLDIWGPTSRSVAFLALLPESEPPIVWRIKERFGLAQRNEYRQSSHMSELSRRVPELPYKVRFRFVPNSFEETEGYEVKIESTPTVLQQYYQGVLSEARDYSRKNVVYTQKQEIRHWMGEMGLEPLRRPYTESELLEPTISETNRKLMEETEYGRTAIQFIDEADKSLQQKLYHAALNCYILGIEWTIIAFLDYTESIDIVEQEKEQDGPGKFFWELVEDLEEQGVASQTTMEKLQKIGNTERHWMAHHKFGEIPVEDVQAVKRRLSVLTDELFS